MIRVAYLALLLVSASAGVASAQSCTPNNNSGFQISGNTLSAGALSAGSSVAGVVATMGGVATCFPVTVTAQTGGGTSACTTSVSTSSTVPCPVGAATAAPSGQHWNLVYEDVFTQDTGARPEWVLQCLDSAGWHPGPACYPGGFVYDSTNGLSLSSTRVAQNVTQQRSQVVMNTPFKFGYWEWSGKNAINVNGEGQGIHSDFYLMRAASTAYAEVDVNEHPNGPNNRWWTNYFINAGSGGTDDLTASYPSTSVGNLDDTFHIYGVWWRNDNLSINGSVQPFLDGNAQLSASPIDGGSNTWAGGAVWTIIEDGCTGDTWGGGQPCPGSVPLLDPDPVMAKYLRIWQLVAN